MAQQRKTRGHLDKPSLRINLNENLLRLSRSRSCEETNSAVHVMTSAAMNFGRGQGLLFSPLKKAGTVATLGLEQGLLFSVQKSIVVNCFK